jgi:hypothetical protein|tara:strand:+ start:438 stop:746 length:309 start_codon:yes stop_codon:yes gene_type:complete
MKMLEENAAMHPRYPRISSDYHALLSLHSELDCRFVDNGIPQHPEMTEVPPNLRLIGRSIADMDEGCMPNIPFLTLDKKTYTILNILARAEYNIVRTLEANT